MTDIESQLVRCAKCQEPVGEHADELCFMCWVETIDEAFHLGEAPPLLPDPSLLAARPRARKRRPSSAAGDERRPSKRARRSPTVARTPSTPSTPVARAATTSADDDFDFAPPAGPPPGFGPVMVELADGRLAEVVPAPLRRAEQQQQENQSQQNQHQPHQHQSHQHQPHQHQSHQHQSHQHQSHQHQSHQQRYPRLPEEFWPADLDFARRYPPGTEFWVIIR